MALKIYKTSILSFKAREDYVVGDYRFRGGFNKSNPRRMVEMWAEKERKNLNRLKAAEIPCPDVILLHKHVLIISFLGKNGQYKIIINYNI